MLRQLCVLVLLVGVALGDSEDHSHDAEGHDYDIHTTSGIYEEEYRVHDELFGRDPKANRKYIKPPGEPTNVTVNMYIRKIFSLNEDNHMWKLQLTFRSEWTDSRLTYNTTNKNMKYFTYGNIGEIWKPDLFFANEVEANHHEQLEPNDLLRITPDGHVTYSTRLTLKMYCPGDFHHKKVVCPMRIASYMYTKEELDIHWSLTDPIEQTKDIHVSKYELESVVPKDCTSKTRMGTFACVQADFTFGHDVCHD